MTAMRVLISGAGIAGPTLAHWLHRFGHEPVIVERAPAPRDGGYVIDFWGTGFEVAERMGLVPALRERGYRVEELREVDAAGRRIAGVDPRPLIERSEGRYVSLARADLAAIVLESLGDRVPISYGDSIAALDDDGDRVQVRFDSGTEEEFDLVIGADGLHSRVRELAFGPEAQFSRDLGIAVAAIELDGYRPRDETLAVTHTVVGAQALRFSGRDDRTIFFFSFRHSGPVPLDDRAAAEQLLRQRLGGMGWEVPAALAAMGASTSPYLDKAAQIRMPSWSTGRIGLIGDAAASPSLLAGQDAALAMVEAYLLAVALRDTGEHARAFASVHAQLAPVVRAKQNAALRLGTVFAPRNRRELWIRNQGLKLVSIPWLANLFIGRSLYDPIELPAG